MWSAFCFLKEKAVLCTRFLRLTLLNFICTGLCYCIQCPRETPQGLASAGSVQDAFYVSSPSQGAPLSRLGPRLSPAPSYCVVLKQVTSPYLSRSNPDNNTSQTNKGFSLSPLSSLDGPHHGNAQRGLGMGCCHHVIR